MEYYKKDLVTLYHGDCTGELLPLLGECDVPITDPPTESTSTPTSPPLPPEVLQAIAELENRGRRGGYQGDTRGDMIILSASTANPIETWGGRETSHSLISSLSPEQHHANMINHLKGLHDPRGS